MNDLDRASQVGTILVDLGPDTPQVNNALIEFVKLLNMERKKADATVTGLGDRANLTEVEAAKRKLGSIETLLGAVAGKLAARQELSPAGMVFVADILGTLGMTAEASQQYQKILARTESDPEFAKAAVKAMPRVRSQLIGILRQQGQYDEALKQVDKLIEENPKALEPRMEKGRILEAWSEKDVRHYKDAVTHWSNLRNALQQIRGKKPPEYYEVMYKVAECLVRDAQTSKDKAAALQRAKQAEQVLKAALTLSPNLNGPDMVARYKTLLNKAMTLQGRPPAATPATVPQKPENNPAAAPSGKAG
jgi:tetratricopeptide (TPR) repeat protein